MIEKETPEASKTTEPNLCLSLCRWIERREEHEVFFALFLSIVRFPASRGSFPGVRWREERDLCHRSKMATLSMLPGLTTEPAHVMLVTRDESKTFHSNDTQTGNIDKPRLGRAIRPTSSLHNVISPHQFQSTDRPSLKELVGSDVFQGFRTAVKHFGIFELRQCIVVVERLPLHFNSFQLESLTGLTLVRYECV